MTSFKICLITILLTVFYILSSVLFSNILFWGESKGSLKKIKKEIVGSKLISQNFTSPLYFHPRPSLSNHKNDISGNSNLPFYSKKLKDNISLNYTNSKNINHNEPPLNLISESASGLDPHITYAGALTQVERVSEFTKIPKKEIIKLVNQTAKPRILGIFGKRIVNVLELNIKIKNYNAY